MLTYFCVRTEGGQYEEIPHAEWEALWIERPERFCGLGIAFYWEERELNDGRKTRLPHGFCYDFIIRDSNERCGTDYRDWIKVPLTCS